MSRSDNGTVDVPLQRTGRSLWKGGGSGHASRTTRVSRPNHQGVHRRPVRWPSRVVASRFRGSRQAWHVVAMAQRGVYRGPLWCGVIVRAVVKTDAARGGPVPSGTSPQRTATRSAPLRDQCPVPVTAARSRVVPPSHATVRWGRVAVGATPARGAGRGWPFTRGRPSVGRGGGGSYTAASPSHVRPDVRGWRCCGQHRAVALVPSPRSPTKRPGRAGTPRLRRASRRRARCAGGG
jgi:hypothetical protein